MSNVYGNNANGWFQPTYAPSAPYGPQVASQGDGNYQVSFQFNRDQYAGTAQRIVQQAAPYAPGAVAGYLAKKGVSRGIRIAKTASRARYRAKGYGGRYGTSKRATSRRTSTTRSTGSMFSGVWGAIKMSALFGGILSIFDNGAKVMHKEITLGQAATNVAGDLAASTVGGAAGAVASAVGTPLLASFFGPASLLVTLGGIALGVGGYVLAENWLRRTPFFQNLQAKVQSTMATVAG